MQHTGTEAGKEVAHHAGSAGDAASADSGAVNHVVLQHLQYHNSGSRRGRADGNKCQVLPCRLASAAQNCSWIGAPIWPDNGGPAGAELPACTGAVIMPSKPAQQHSHTVVQSCTE